MVGELGGQTRITPQSIPISVFVDPKGAVDPFEDPEALKSAVYGLIEVKPFLLQIPVIGQR
jgi:hypothetical protein